MNPSVDSNAVVTSQPYSLLSDGDSTNWIHNPSYAAGYPGLEYLKYMSLIVTHKHEMNKDNCCSTITTYTIMNNFGQTLYAGSEEVSCCAREGDGQSRNFDVKIKDGAENEIAQFLLDKSCCRNICACCTQRLEVYAPLGNLTGSVTQDCSFLTASYSVHSPEGKKIFEIRAPMRVCLKGPSITFYIYRAGDQHQVGQIKKYARKGRECYQITFPPELEVEQKITLLGALFLFDYKLYDDNKIRPRNRNY